MSPRASGAAGAFLLALGIGVGALGAHTLADVLTPERLGTLDTAARYQVYGSLGLLLLSVIGRTGSPALASASKRSAALLTVGLLLFCGALYGLVAGGPGILGLVAPFGGAAMILAWAYLGFAIWRDRT